MGIIGSFLGKREPVVEYRTVDGGHPAPYPDMTDEQLYNYEMAFNVPHRTFNKPPRAARVKEDAPMKNEPRAAQHDKAFDAPRYAAHATRTAKEPPAMREPVAQEHAIKPAAPPALLDLSKPVRTVTTKQPVEIITTRARHPVYKVQGYIGNDDIVTLFTLDGRISENGPRFLENMPQTQQLHLNIYPNSQPRDGQRYLVTQHHTKEAAEAAAKPGRITCVAVWLDS